MGLLLQNLQVFRIKKMSTKLTELKYILNDATDSMQSWTLVTVKMSDVTALQKQLF